MTELPTDAVAEAERLTLLALRSSDEEEADAHRADRDARLAEHGFCARIRKGERREILVLYPSEWIVDGTVQLDRIEDRSRAFEIPLGGVGDEDEWGVVEAHNGRLVERVEDDAGPAHAANVRAFADFMGNHYVRRVESAGDREVREFLEEYYPRNAWPNEEQRAVVRESLRLAFEAAEREPPVTLK